ncbi:MAG: UDP-N-acetylglucosamine 2-epimerase (non-hydrolysing) [Desulfobacteraceae bacterium Eth-SRB1]|nr:MAG: UDP-N-acetylglucosamine 2-epimerase (non-hydrolysing) [Desulfobacteraceae bacterium Eth-SRB1]
MILVAYGTRPEIIKLFPIINELKMQGVPFKTLFTGQQLDLYEDVQDLVPRPDFSFSEYFSGENRHNTLGMSFVKICEAAGKLFNEHRFDIIIIQGDTTTAWALAQMAFYNGIKIAHVEAGLRTFDLKNPYPEELNRTLITQVAYLNLAPTKQAYDNLINSGAKNVHLVGNTIVDAVNYFKSSLGLSEEKSNKILVTLHRRENHKIMWQLFDELQVVAEKNPELELIFPIHPNPEVKKYKTRLKAKNIQVIQPIGYPEMLKLISQALFIISDSGGIQEEATCFNKKVLIVREKTERSETIDVGLGKLVGKDIRNHIDWALMSPLNITEPPYGDGHTAQRIVNILSSDHYVRNNP